MESIEHRLDVLEERVTRHGLEIDSLMLDEARTSTVLERLDKTVAALELTVRKLEQIPAKRWESVVSTGLTALVAALAGALFMKLGLG